jgi:hypothetical protein
MHGEIGGLKRREGGARTALVLFAIVWLAAALVGGYASISMEPFHPVPVPGFTPSHHGAIGRFFLDPWGHWDGQWYLRIAQSGYANDGSAAFFPLYPALVRVTAPLAGGNRLAAALLISWIAFAAALVVLGRLLAEDIGEPAATNALLLLAAFPTAFYFHAAYTESLFLALAAGAFLASRHGRWLTAGTLALFAALTRSTGFLLVPALAVEAWARARRPDGRSGWRDLFSREGLSSLVRAPGRSFVAAAIPLLALPVLLLLFDRTLGDPLAFSHAQRLWERHAAAPWSAIIDGVRVLLPGAPRLLDPLPGGAPRLAHYAGGFLESNAYNLAAALGGLALAGLAVRRLPPAYGVFAVCGVLLPLLNPSRVLPLYSIPRFLVVLFPMFAALALPLSTRPVLRGAVLVLAACIQGLFAARFALWYWVA